MYIRKAKNEDDYNEEGGVEERQETYNKPHYWAESQKVESEADNRGNFFISFYYFTFYAKNFSIFIVVVYFSLIILILFY